MPLKRARSDWGASLLPVDTDAQTPQKKYFCFFLFLGWTFFSCRAGLKTAFVEPGLALVHEVEPVYHQKCSNFASFRMLVPIRSGISRVMSGPSCFGGYLTSEADAGPKF